MNQLRYVAYAHGMAENKADRWGLSHLEPPKSQPTLESKSVWCANMFLHKGLIHQIRCCLCARDGREPCRTMQNHADRWGLSHLEPPKSQPTLVEWKSFQVDVPTCLSERVLDWTRYVAYVHGMAWNHADRWGTFALKNSLITTYTDRIFQDWSAKMFLDKGFIDQIRCCLCARNGREPCRTTQIGGDFRT